MFKRMRFEQTSRARRKNGSLCGSTLEVDFRHSVVLAASNAFADSAWELGSTLSADEARLF